MIRATLIFFAAIFAMTTSAQTTTLAIRGGAEQHSSDFSTFLSSDKTAWNIGVEYARPLYGSKRWSSEFGAFFGILEFNGQGRRIEDVDTMPKLMTYGQVYPPGYTIYEIYDYSKTTFLRFQAGVNYTIIDSKKLRFSAGINAANGVVLRYWGRIKGVMIPTIEHPELPVIYYNSNDYNYTPQKITLMLQPHVDVAWQLSDRISAGLRLAYYHHFFFTESTYKGIMQLNAGVAYSFKSKMSEN